MDAPTPTSDLVLSPSDDLAQPPETVDPPPKRRSRRVPVNAGAVTPPAPTRARASRKPAARGKSAARPGLKPPVESLVPPAPVPPEPVPIESIPMDSAPVEATLTENPPTEPAPSAAEPTSADMEPIAPTPNSIQPLPLKRRSREEPLPASPEPAAEIMDLAGRLQDLIGRRREEETLPPVSSSPRDNRLRPSVSPVPANPDEEVLSVLAQARTAPARIGGTSYQGPSAEDHLEASAGRWFRRALWPVLCALVAVFAFGFGRRATTADRNAAATRDTIAAPAFTGTPAPASAASKPAAPHWSEKSLTALDDVLTARRADPARAGALARSLRLEGGDLLGLDLFLAENLLHANGPNEATTALLLMMRADPAPAPVAARLGFIFARTRRLDESATHFALACAADPFRGDYLFRWGEALRRQGRSVEAVTRFDEALLRPANDEGSRPAPPECVFRRRLARLEAGDVNGVRRETAAALSNPAVGPETGRWLLTAAALELFDNHPAPAVAALARARAAVSPAEWDRLTGDLFFRNYADRKEFAEFLPPAGSPADARRIAALNAMPDVDFIDP